MSKPSNLESMRCLWKSRARESNLLLVIAKDDAALIIQTKDYWFNFRMDFPLFSYKKLFYSNFCSVVTVLLLEIHSVITGSNSKPGINTRCFVHNHKTFPLWKNTGATHSRDVERQGKAQKRASARPG